MNRTIQFIFLITFFSFGLNANLIKQSEAASNSTELSSNSEERIQPYSGNPVYWQYNGDPILLISGSSNDNLFQHSYDELIEELDKLIEHGGNYLRNTMSNRDPGNIQAFYFDEEQGLYDLGRWNDDYWKMFDRYLRATHERGIIVQIEIWATYDFYTRAEYFRDGLTTWQRNPFNPRNNINYEEGRNSGLVSNFQSDHDYLVNPFFYTVLPLPEPFDFSIQPTLLYYQQRFVRKVMETSLPYNHVLYVIDNETNTDPKWPRYWSQFINKIAADHNRQIEVTEMWDTFDPTDGNVEEAARQPYDSHFFSKRASVSNTLYDTDNYTYVDISNHNFQTGETHYKTGLYIWNEIQRSRILRPTNNTKIYGAGDEWSWTGDRQEAGERFWRNIFAGHASARFHRQPYGEGNNEYALRHVKSMSILMNELIHDFTSLRPDNSLLHNRQENEAYVLADDGNTYAVAFMNGGNVSLDISKINAEEATLIWLNVMENGWTSEIAELNPETGLKLQTPEETGFWVAVVKK